MKIAMVSTFPPQQCGIATYTYKLCAGITEVTSDSQELLVLCEQGGKPGESGLVCVPCFERGSDLSMGIVSAATKQGVQIAHFQHAPDIFGVGDAMLETLRKLKNVGVMTVVTLHTVFTRRSGLLERKPFMASFHKKLGEVADAIIVHTTSSARILEAHGVAQNKISVIAHGTDLSKPGDTAVGRRVLTVNESNRTLLFFGFIHVQKNIQVLIKAMPKVIAKVPDAALIIAGKVSGGAWYNRMYLSYLQRLIKKRGLNESVKIIDSFIPNENVEDIHAASEMVLLPHNQGYASASGVVHGAMAMKMPMLCSKSPKFEEVAEKIDANLLVKTTDSHEWAQMITRLLVDREYHALISKRSANYANETAWPVVGAQHIKLYQEVAGS